MMQMLTPAKRLRLGLLLASLAGASCDATGPRVYTARQYQPELACLDEYAPLALVESGELPSTCAPVCLRVDGALYVSSVCAPYPARAARELADDSPECGDALAAAEAEAFCADVPADAGP
jgi:hypothetical protein